MKIENNKLILKIELFGEHTSKVVDGLIDTGTSYLIIPHILGDVLGVKIDKNEPRIKLTTASGVVEATKVILKRVKVNELELENVETILHDLPDPVPTKVLLGMSVLMKLKTVIDGKNEEFTLEDP
jgi:clan AA aspartic protease (TIGR02281 family)